MGGPAGARLGVEIRGEQVRARHQLVGYAAPRGRPSLLCATPHHTKQPHTAPHHTAAHHITPQHTTRHGITHGHHIPSPHASPIHYECNRTQTHPHTGWGSYPSQRACLDAAGGGFEPSAAGIDPATYPPPPASPYANTCGYNPNSRTRWV